MWRASSGICPRSSRRSASLPTPSLGLQSNVAGESTEVFAAKIPLHRLGTPEDVGAAAVYLASSEASWMTGQILNLNGGSVTS
ncbi:SDR family oxidoreductase [Streptomyces sp. NPDC058375]|uniref:SDR family oxidoreductase n=1 Tax=Streptomyces sp. NPDC058375 TaxID=3346467 RepID=UPI00364E36EE